MLSTPPASLDALILGATSPLVKHEEPSAVQAVVAAVSSDATAPAAAIRILAHKIHSPQEREAMKALSVLQACVINCGPSFHSEIGKFRFLNEMIKLVSPKYSGSHTPPAIKSRVLELLFCWMTDLTAEPKIAEAYNMLKKQGVVKTDPVYIGPLTLPLPVPRSSSSSSVLEDSERSQQLQRLLQSRRPDDLQRANALIRAMVRDDQRRAEQSTHTAMELEMARNNVKVLDEMLSEFEQRGGVAGTGGGSGGCGGGHVALMTELHNTCISLRSSLHLAAADRCSTDKRADMSDFIQVHEDLSRVMVRYQRLVEKRHAIVCITNEKDVEKLNFAVSAAITSISTQEASSGEGGGVAADMLLDLTTPPEEKPVPAAATDLMNQELNNLGLGDSTASSLISPTSSTAQLSVGQIPAVGATGHAGGCTSDTLLDALADGAPFTSVAQPTASFTAVTAMAVHASPCPTGLATPLKPQSSQRQVKDVVPADVEDGGSEDKSRQNPLDVLDVLGRSLLQSSLPLHASSVGPNFRPPEKLSMNQLKQRLAQHPDASHSTARKPSANQSDVKASATILRQSLPHATVNSVKPALTSILSEESAANMNQRNSDNYDSLLVNNDTGTSSQNNSTRETCATNDLLNISSSDTNSSSLSVDKNTETSTSIKEIVKIDDLLDETILTSVSGQNQINNSTKDNFINSNGDRRLESEDQEKAICNKSSLSNAQFLEVKPMNDIKISIENIIPGNQEPLSLLDTTVVTTRLYHTLNSPRRDVSVFVLTTTSRSPLPLSQYVMQAVVAKGCKVRLLPPSSTALQQYSPFLPPPAVTQVMLLANPNQVNVSLKLMLSYCVGDDDPVTEMAELDHLVL